MKKKIRVVSYMDVVIMSLLSVVTFQTSHQGIYHNENLVWGMIFGSLLLIYFILFLYFDYENYKIEEEKNGNYSIHRF